MIVIAASVFLYVILIFHLISSAQNTFIAMKKQLLESVDKIDLVAHVGSNDTDSMDKFLWNYLQDRSLKILSKKNWQIFKHIFLEGGLVLLSWSIISCLLFFKNDYGITSFLPKQYFWDFLIAQIPIFVSFYFWHLKRFGKYVLMGEQEKFLEDAKKYLKSLSRRHK